MAHYSIKDLEKLSGIKAHTIRIWEKRYQLIKPERTCTNIRLYSDCDLRRIMNVSILNRRGLKISLIANLTEEEMRDKIVMLTQSTFSQDDQVENLVVSMIDLDEQRFEKILSASVLKLGFEDTFHRVIFPLLDKIGLLWQAGTVNPAHEHFISNLLRQKLIVAIDGLIPADNGTQKTFVLFLPEGEMHELGLLYYYYLVKKKGHKVLYLGSSVPLNDLSEVLRNYPAHYLVSFFVTNLDKKKYAELLKLYGREFSNQQVILSGIVARNSSEPLPENVRVINSPLDFGHFLSGIS